MALVDTTWIKLIIFQKNYQIYKLQVNAFDKTIEILALCIVKKIQYFLNQVCKGNEMILVGDCVINTDLTKHVLECIFHEFLIIIYLNLMNTSCAIK